jgi:hypothetical protein
MPAAATAADLMRRIGLYLDSRRDIAVRHALALVEAGLGADPDGSSARVLGAISNAGPYDVTVVLATLEQLANRGNAGDGGDASNSSDAGRQP